MPGNYSYDVNQPSECEEPIGQRHAISKLHLKLIADSEFKIRANRDTTSFHESVERYESMQRVSISQFSAGKWACQKHDQMFAGLDVNRIDLSDQENLFKAVYRVVLRQNLLHLSRYCAIFENIQRKEDWLQFKETAFNHSMSDEEAENMLIQMRNVASAINTKADELGRRFREHDWNSLEIRAFLLDSQPTVAGWDCWILNEPGRENFLDLGYTVVIPQENGHAIITACESSNRYRVRDITKIHTIIPIDSKPNQPYKSTGRLKAELSKRVWNFNEIGVKNSLYSSWVEIEKNNVQAWMKNTRKSAPPQSLQSNNLPSLF